MTLSGCKVNQPSLSQKINPLVIFQDIFIDAVTHITDYLLAEPFQGRYIYLNVEMSAVGDNRSVLHRTEVLSPYDIFIARKRYEQLTNFCRLCHRHNFKPVHSCFKGLDRINFCNNNNRPHPPGPHSKAAPAPAVTCHNNFFASH